MEPRGEARPMVMPCAVMTLLRAVMDTSHFGPFVLALSSLNWMPLEM